MESKSVNGNEYKFWFQALKAHYKLCKSVFKSLKTRMESLAKQHNYVLDWNYTYPVLIDQTGNRLYKNELYRFLVATGNWTYLGHEFMDYFWYLEIFSNEGKWDLRRHLNLVGSLKKYSERPLILIMNPLESYQHHERMLKEKIANLLSNSYDI